MEEKCKWGGKRNCAGRKKTCLNKITFTRRINENILNILKQYASKNDMTDTEALEYAILLQSNIHKQKGDKFMKIAIPTAEGKLCGHFGHCECFTFVEANPETKEILNIEERIPDEGISCQSAGWIAEQGVNVVLAGGMGGRPYNIFCECGVTVVTGCPELDIREIVTAYLSSELVTGENTCGGGGHCHGEGHHCGHHH